MVGPSQVIIIRHAEKPDEGLDLSDRGRERALALVGFFQQNYPKISDLFAAKRSPDSNRPVETLEPYSKKASKDIDDSFTEHMSDDIASTILKNPKYGRATVLICWHHEKIPELAQALGADAPDRWNGKMVFDRVWEITYEDGGAVFRDRPQNLLPGDSRE